MRKIVWSLMFVLCCATIAFAASRKFSYIQTNFTAGELTPKMDGRVDFPKYFNAVRTLDNFIIYPQGGVTRRPGFEYIATAKTTNEQVRLIPFEFSTTQAYILEFGKEYMRVYMDGGQVYTVDTPTSLLLHCDGVDNSTSFTDDGNSTEWTTQVITANGNASVETSYFKFGSGSASFDGAGDYLSIPDHADFDFEGGDFTIEFWAKSTRGLTFDDYPIGQYDTANDYFTFEIKDTGASETIRFVAKEGGIEVIDIESPDLDATFGQWHHYAVVRSGNFFYLFFDGERVKADTSATDMPNVGNNKTFNIGAVAGNYFKGYIDEVRVSRSDDGHGGARWTNDFTPASVAYPLNGDGTVYELVTPYQTSELWDLKFAQSADTMWIVHPDRKPKKLTRTDHDSWSINNYTPTSDPFTASTPSKYPYCVAFYDERLVFGGTNATPQGLFFSVVGDLESMSINSTADDFGLRVEIAADQVNTIQWLEPGKILALGTVGGEWKVGASSLDEAITPTNILVRRETAHGVNGVQPLTVGKDILFVQRSGKKIRQFGYNLDVDGYISTDLTILADHIIDSPIIEMDYQQEPYSIVWIVTQDGGLYSLTYEKEHDVVAWARHTVGGTNPEVKSVAVIPGDGYDEVWISVERDLTSVYGSGRCNYIERMKPLFSGESTPDAFFLDSGLSYEGAGAQTVSGLDHLEGETLVALCDGKNVTSPNATTPANVNLTVTSGVINVGEVCQKIHAGLTYNSDIQTLRMALPSEGAGNIQGKTKRISDVIIRMLESAEFKVGRDFDHLDEMDFDNGSALFSGDKMILFNGNYDTDAYIYIRQDKPLPLTILSIMPEVRISE